MNSKEKIYRILKGICLAIGVIQVLGLCTLSYGQGCPDSKSIAFQVEKENSKGNSIIILFDNNDNLIDKNAYALLDNESSEFLYKRGENENLEVSLGRVKFKNVPTGQYEVVYFNDNCPAKGIFIPPKVEVIKVEN